MRADLVLMPECQVLHLRLEQGTVELLLTVPIELAHFQGHFPGFGILPGVVQIDWAVRLARRFFTLPSDGFQGMDQVKFQALVRPAARLHLALQWDARRRRLDFAYREGPKESSTGRLTWRAVT